MIAKWKKHISHYFYSIFEYLFIIFGHKFTVTYRKMVGEFHFKDFEDLVKLDSSIVIEIGANDGESTEEILKYFPKSKVFAFEPDKRAVEEFKKRFRGDNRVELAKILVTEEMDKHKIDFFPSDKNTFVKSNEINWHYSGSYLRPHTHLVRHPTINFSGTNKVDRTTLDSWYSTKNLELINLIWMDTQGAEYKILTGATQILSNALYIFMEYSLFELYRGQRTLKSTLKLLPGWRVLKLYPHDVLLENIKLHERIEGGQI
jgi:FkbM family methyltransferase